MLLPSNLANRLFMTNCAISSFSSLFAGLYALYLAILLLLYTVVPLPLYGTFLIGVAYSTLLEVLLCHALPERVENKSTVIGE